MVATAAPHPRRRDARAPGIGTDSFLAALREDLAVQVFGQDWDVRVRGDVAAPVLEDDLFAWLR